MLACRAPLPSNIGSFKERNQIHPSVRRQTASSLGLLAVLLGFVVLIAAFLLSSTAVCPSGEGPQYCSVPESGVSLGTELGIVGGMTVLLGVVVLLLSRSIPSAPRPAKQPVSKERPAEFEDLWADQPDRTGNSR